jgi:hypothetical protein
MSMAMDADDPEVDAAASSVGALHMNPFRSNGSAGLARAPWSRQQATAAFAKHVQIALSLALGAKACDQDHHMVVALAMKKDGLVLPGSRQEGRPAHAPVRSAAVATDECCVALAFTQAPRADRACPSVWPAQLISELVENFAGAAIEEIIIDSRRDCGRHSAWALPAGVPLVARALNRMVAPAKAFDGNEARFGTSFVLYSGLISLATGNLCHRKLLVHDALTHPADTCAIRVVGRFRARWLSYALLPQYAPLSTRDDMLFLAVDEASIARFVELQTTGLCDSAPTSAHSILGRPLRGATPEYENSRNESSLSSATRSGSLASSDSPEFTADGASAGAVNTPSASIMFSPASRGKRALPDGVSAVPTPPTQSKASGSGRFPDACP